MVPNYLMMYTMLTATGTGVIESLMAIWTAISTWIVSSISSVSVIFYSAETGLTLLGVLAVSSLGIGVIFLLIGVVQKFFHFRG